MNEKDSTDPINGIKQKNLFHGMHELSNRDATSATNPTNAKNAKNTTNPTNPKNTINPKTQRRMSVQKQSQPKVTIRKDASVKKKKTKEPFSYKYIKKRFGDLWHNSWEIIVTVILALIFVVYILPRFLS